MNKHCRRYTGGDARGGNAKRFLTTKIRLHRGPVPVAVSIKAGRSIAALVEKKRGDRDKRSRHSHWWYALVPSIPKMALLIALEFLAGGALVIAGISNNHLANEKARTVQTQNTRDVQTESTHSTAEPAKSSPPANEAKSQKKTSQPEADKNKAATLNSSTSLTMSDAKQAAQTFESYHQAQDIRKAYSYFDDTMKEQIGSYTEFARGYAHTIDSTVTDGHLNAAGLSMSATGNQKA